MGVYENIINSKKKKDEEESLYERITGEKTSAKEKYEEQKKVLTKAQKEYSTALNKEYKNTGAFDFTLPTKIQQNEFLNKILPSSKTTQSTHSPFDTKQTLEKIKIAQNNVKDLKTTVDEEYNKLKYAKALKNAEKVENEKTTLWDKTGGVIIRGLTDVVSSLGMDKYTYIDEDGNKIYLPTYNDLKQQKVSQDYDSGLGKFLGDTVYNTTKILGTTAINSLAPGVGTFTYWQDMYMDNYKNTVNQGYDDIRSSAYALTSTGLEYLTGKFLGSATKGLTGGKSSELSNALSNATMRLTNNSTISRILGEAGSEATEEFLQEYLDNINRLVTLENTTNIDDYVSIFSDSKILEDALYSAAVGALSGGFIAGTDVSSNKNTNQNVQMFKEFKTQLEEAKKFTTDVSKIEQYDNAINKINEYLKKPFTNNEISLPKINTNQEMNVQQNINNINTINKTTEGLDLIESSKVYNIDSTSETINSINNLLNKRNINGRFDSTLFNNTKTNAFWTVDSNGNRNVIFNPNANTNDLLQNVAIHELTHDLLSSKNSAEILNSNDIIDYVSKIDGYQEARQSLAKSYSEVYDINDPRFETMVDEEVVASVLGNKLGNQEFVNRLTTENLSLSKKIYNWIVDRINQLKNLVGYKSEKAYWNDVKNRFEKAYKMSYNNINKQADIRMSIYSGNAKYKNKTLNSIVFAKAVSIGETNFSVRDANNYYIIDNAIDGNYDIFKVYPIEGNEEFLNNLDKLRGEYNANRNRTSNSKNTARIEDRLGFNSGNNANVEGEQSWTEFIDSVLETVRQEKSDNKRFSIESGRNNRELDNSSFSFDNQGRTLTKEQQEYFKDSKVRDENGNLLTMYHGTSSGGHTVFDPYGGKPGLFGQGSYFTDNNSVAESYTQKGRGNNKQIYEVYLNIINPIDMDVQANVEEWKQNFSKFLPDADFPKSGTNEALYRSALEEFENSEYDRFEVAEIMIETFQKMGYDGITHIGGGRFNQKDGTRHRVFITFESNQIKNIDNTNPTSNDDIRYSQKNKNWDEFVNKNFKSEGTGKTLQELKLPTTKNKNEISLPKIDANQEINVQQNLEKLSTKNNINLPKPTNVDSDIFSKQVDEVVNGTFNKDNHMTVLEHTPEVLRKLGVKDLPITLTTSKLDRIMNESGKQKGEYHGLKETVKKLPQAIQNPLDIVKSYDNSYVLTTDLSDNQDRSVIVSLKIDGKGYIDNIEIDTNVMTSAYGRNNYDNWMKKHQEEGNIIYDIDRGYIDTKKLGAIPGLQLPNNNIKSIGDSTRIQYPRSTTPFLNDNNTTNSTKSQIAPLPSQYSMQQNVKNDTKIPSSKESKEKISMPAVRQNSEVLKVQSERIANQINKTGDINLKERSWVETSTESQVLKDKVLISDLDTGKINYVVQSNKKSLDRANDKLNNLGYEKSVNYVKELINSEKLPNASDIALAQRVLQESAKKGDIETTQELVMDIAILGTDLGQATQALSIIQRLTPEGQLKLYTKIVQRAKVRGEKSFQSVEITPEMVQNILEAYKADGTYDQNDLNARVEKFKQDIADQLKTTTAEKVNTWRYLAMLGNPKTHIRNLVSNVAMKYTLKAKNAVARTFETMIPLETKTKTWKKASDVVQKFADKTTKEMKNIITGEAKYSDKGSIEAKKQIFKNKTLEKISDFNSNALSAEDWFFSKSAFKNTFQEYLTANGISTESDIQNNPEIIEKAKQYAVEQAEIATFRQYSKLASQISQIERRNKFARLAIESTVPFKKTPINVAKTGFKYSPLGLIKNVSYDVYQLKQGNINGSQFIDNLSQGITGTTLTLIGYALAKAGILSGAGDDDKEGKYDYNLGRQSYALNIGGDSYSISWLSPVAIPLLVGANAYEKLEEQEDWNPDVIADTLAQTLDPLSEMSFVSSLTDVLTSYNSGSTTMIKDIGETATQSYILQFFPTLFSQFANVLDDKKRSTKVSNNSSFKFGEETIRKVMYKIPGLRNQLEVATDIWGNEKEQSSNIIERAVESFIAPYSKNKDISTTLDNEIKRVYNETGDDSIIPNIPYAYTKYQGTTYRMSAKEYTEFKKTYGNTANSCLNELIKSKSYKEATVEEQSKMLGNVYDYARAKANAEYFNNIEDVDYTNDILTKMDSLQKKYGITASAYYANKKQYDYAYSYPEKYAVISKITSFDKYNTYKEKLGDIRANTTNDKTETIKYINNLNLSIPQKAMFIKMYYPSFDNYNKQIINYVNSQSMTVEEKTKILEELGFTVRNGRVY